MATLPADLSIPLNMASSATSGQSPQAMPVRPSVLSLAIREKAALYSAYMPFLINGGIFVPTNRTYHLGEEIYLI